MYLSMNGRMRNINHRKAYIVAECLSSQVVNMDITRKIPKEDIELLDELQEGLRKRDIKITQKDLIDNAIKFSLKENKPEFIDYIKNLKMRKLQKGQEEEYLWKEFLNNKIRIKGDILKEHDTIL